MNAAPQLPLKWDMDAVREFYAERGMDYDKFGPQSYARIRRLGDHDEQDNFCEEFAEFLRKRNEKTTLSNEREDRTSENA